jgi:hypothetical protein
MDEILYKFFDNEEKIEDFSAKLNKTEILIPLSNLKIADSHTFEIKTVGQNDS